MIDLSRIEIPFGVSCSGETVAIPLIIPHRNHCFITGAPGSGKSTLLKEIIESIGRYYYKSQVLVWTDYFSHNNKTSQNSPVLEVSIPDDINPGDRMIALFERLYNEAQNRLKALSLNGIASFRQADSMPLLIAVIDDLYPFDYSERSRYVAEKLCSVLRMSHVVGMSLICASQLPIFGEHEMAPVMADLFNVRIALRSFKDYIFETLGINPSDISTEEIRAIDSLATGNPGDFLYYNRYESESLFFGRVDPIAE